MVFRITRTSPRRGGSQIQAVLFDKHHNTPSYANGWLARNQMRPIKPFHITDRYIRSRINQPSPPMRTIALDKDRNIKAVVNVVSGRGVRRRHKKGRGVIGSDLAAGAATVGSILAAIAAKKIYDKVKGKGIALHPKSKPIPQRHLPVRRYGAGYLDSNPMLIESLLTSALAGLAIAGIVKAAKK